MKRRTLSLIFSFAATLCFLSCEEANVEPVVEAPISTDNARLAQTVNYTPPEAPAVQASFPEATNATSNEAKVPKYEKKLIDWREKADFTEIQEFAPARINHNRDQNALDDFFLSYDQPVQKRTLEPNEETTFTLDQGTTIAVPTNAFVHEDGSNVTGEVTFEAQEYYNIEDMVLAGLNTNADDKILESGGMLNLQAFEDGKPLNLREGKELQVDMPITGEYKEDMELYLTEKHGKSRYGKLWRHNWKLMMNKRKREPKDEKARMPRELIEINSSTKLIRKGSAPKEIETFQHADFEEARQIGKAGSTQLLVTFNHNGKVLEYKRPMKKGALKRSTRARFYKVHKRTWRGWSPQKPKDEKGSFVYEVKKGGIYANKPFDSRFVRKIYRDNNIPRKENIQLLFDRELVYGRGVQAKIEMLKSGMSMEKIMSSEISPEEYYQFAVPAMGMVNCDRLFQPKRQAINIEVAVDKDEVVDLRMVVGSSRVVLNGIRRKGKVVFYNVPTGSRFKVLAYKSEGGKIYRAQFTGAATKRRFNNKLNYQQVDNPSFKATTAAFLEE